MLGYLLECYAHLHLTTLCATRLMPAGHRRRHQLVAKGHACREGAVGG